MANRNQQKEFRQLEILERASFFVLLTLFAPGLLVLNLFSGIAIAQASFSQSSQPATHLKFTLLNSARIPARGGIIGEVSHYKSEDGVIVEHTTLWYKSKGAALSELERLAKDAKTKVQRDTKKDGDGHEVGQRVEFRSKSPKTPSEVIIVAWVVDKKLVKLMSSSEKHVLDMEAQIYRPSVQKATPGM